MSPIEIIALLVAAIGIIKIIILLIKPKAWKKVPDVVFNRPVLTMIVGLILAGLVLYYLLAELSIVQIFAVIAFVMLLVVASYSAYAKEMKSMMGKLLKDRKALKKAWLIVVVWLALSVWVIIEIFNLGASWSCLG
ncbi:hypothetical protein ACFLZX_05440 [Nanoarchaeota archaeon]